MVAGWLSSILIAQALTLKETITPIRVSYYSTDSLSLNTKSLLFLVLFPPFTPQKTYRIFKPEARDILVLIYFFVS